MNRITSIKKYGNSSLTCEISYRYEMEGFLTETIFFDEVSGDQIQRIMSKYPVDGLLSAINEYDEDNVLFHKKRYKYDEGRLMEIRLIDPLEHTEKKTRLFYDGKERLRQENNFDQDGYLSSRQLYEYDDHDNWIVKRTYETNNLREEYEVLSSKEERKITYFE